MSITTNGFPIRSFVQTRHSDNGTPQRRRHRLSPRMERSIRAGCVLPLQYFICRAAGDEEYPAQLPLHTRRRRRNRRQTRAGRSARKFLSMPILASMAWKYFQLHKTRISSTKPFPKLVKFFWSWFSGAHDRNRDGTPEWDHILQTGFEDNPLFDVWNPWSQGLDVSFVHSPSLESMLYREAQMLAKSPINWASPKKKPRS
jgi:hypothetical protein